MPKHDPAICQGTQCDTLRAKLAEYKTTHATSLRINEENNSLRLELAQAYGERNAAQAQLTEAMDALRHTCAHLCQWKDACETGCLVGNVLAGHAPATPQQEGKKS